MDYKNRQHDIIDIIFSLSLYVRQIKKIMGKMNNPKMIVIFVSSPISTLSVEDRDGDKISIDINNDVASKIISSIAMILLDVLSKHVNELKKYVNELEIKHDSE